MSYLRPTLAIRQTACSTQASGSAANVTQAICEEEELEPSDACSLQPKAVASMAGVSEGGASSHVHRRRYQVLNVGRRVASRVDMAALFKLTNHSLGTLERSVERLRLNVEWLYPQLEEDEDFIVGTLHSVRSGHNTALSYA